MRRRPILTFWFGMLGVLVASSPAAAHVSVQPGAVAAGATVDLTFMVPSEEPSSPTTKVELFFPADVDIPLIDTPTVSGWSPTINRDGDRVTSVAWAAGSIAAGESKAFPLTLQVPTTTERLVIKVLQTYRDGTVVRWIDEPVAGAAGSAHPTPVLEISGSTPTTSTTADPVATTTTVPGAAPAAKKGGGFSIGSILIGFGVLAIIFAFARTRGLARRSAAGRRRR